MLTVQYEYTEKDKDCQILLLILVIVKSLQSQCWRQNSDSAADMDKNAFFYIWEIPTGFENCHCWNLKFNLAEISNKFLRRKKTKSLKLHQVAVASQPV